MVEKIVITSLSVIAIWATMLYGMIFGFIGDLGQKLPVWLQKPIYDCPICMCFWYGSAIYWMVWGVSISEWLLVVISSMGLVTWFVKTKND